MEFAERLSVRLTKEQSRKLDALELATRRDRSQIIRLLVDAAISSDVPDIRLDAARLEGRGCRYG